MPTYEYKCRDCGHRFEVVQSFSDQPLRKCDECGGELGKIFGNIGISFKGSGFYRTDSRSTVPAKGANGKDSAGSSDKSDAKSDSEPSSKPDSKSASGSGDSNAASPKSDATKSGPSKSDASKSDASKSGASKSGAPRSPASK